MGSIPSGGRKIWKCKKIHHNPATMGSCQFQAWEIGESGGDFWWDQKVFKWRALWRIRDVFGRCLRTAFISCRTGVQLGCRKAMLIRPYSSSGRSARVCCTADHLLSMKVARRKGLRVFSRESTLSVWGSEIG